MNNKKNLNNKIIAIFGIITIAMFFMYSVVITMDSSHYVWLSKMIGNNSFENWDIIRGIVFPMYVKISTLLFGANVNGLKIGMFIMYCIMILFSYFMFKDCIKNDNIASKRFKYFILFAFWVLVIINPIIFGYYHTLLTEFVGITFGVVGCYFAWKWIDIYFIEKIKLKYILYTFLFSILTIFAWHLKQPYVGTILFPLIISTIISFVRIHNKKNIISKIIAIIIVVISLVISMKVWNEILSLNGVKLNESRSSSSTFSLSIIEGISEYNFKIYDIKNFEREDIDSKFKKEIENNKDLFKSYIIMESPSGEKEIMFLKEKMPSTNEALQYMFKILFGDPQNYFKGQVKNYLAICNIYQIAFENAKCYNTNNYLKLTLGNENTAIPKRIYLYNDSNCFYIPVEEYNEGIETFKEINKPIVSINFVMKKLMSVCTVWNKIIFVLLPFFTIISIVRYFINQKKYNQKYYNTLILIIILYSFSLTHILSHSVLGAMIDRYTAPAMIPTTIGIILEMYLIVYRNSLKQEECKKLLNDKKEEGLENEKM